MSTNGFPLYDWNIKIKNIPKLQLQILETYFEKSKIRKEPIEKTVKNKAKVLRKREMVLKKITKLLIHR